MPSLEFPDELLCFIFCNVHNVRDKMSLGLVSRQFRRCVDWRNSSSNIVIDFNTLKLCQSRVSYSKWPFAIESLITKGHINRMEIIFCLNSVNMFDFLTIFGKDCELAHYFYEVSVTSPHSLYECSVPNSFFLFLQRCHNLSKVLFTNVNCNKCNGRLSSSLRSKSVNELSLGHVLLPLYSPPIATICNSFNGNSLNSLTLSLNKMTAPGLADFLGRLNDKCRMNLTSLTLKFDRNLTEPESGIVQLLPHLNSVFPQLQKFEVHHKRVNVRQMVVYLTDCLDGAQISPLKCEFFIESADKSDIIVIECFKALHPDKRVKEELTGYSITCGMATIHLSVLPQVYETAITTLTTLNIERNSSLKKLMKWIKKCFC